MADNYGLLIAALVAIVAVVGLVVLFSGAKVGGAYVVDREHRMVSLCGEGQMAVLVEASGGLECMNMEDVTMVRFDRPLGHAGAAKKFTYPGT